MRGGVDEAHGGDGLAGAGRVLEPEALGRVGVLGRLLELVLVERHLGGVGRLLGLRLVLVLVVLVVVVVELRLDGLEVVVDGQHRLRGGLRGAFHERLGEQRGERARQRVDLVRVQQRAVGEARLLLRQEPFEPEQERPGARPLRGRVREAVVELAQGGVERAAAVRAGCEDLHGVLPGQHEPFARELLRALDLVGGGDGRGREGHWREISQGGVRNSDGRAEARAGKPGRTDPGVALRLNGGGPQEDVAPPRQEQCTGPRGRFCQAGNGAQVAHRHRARGSRRGRGRRAHPGGRRRAVAADDHHLHAGRGHGTAGRTAAEARGAARAFGRARRRRTAAVRPRAEGPARDAGRREPLGLLVRALPLRDPLHAARVPPSTARRSRSSA